MHREASKVAVDFSIPRILTSISYDGHTTWSSCDFPKNLVLSRGKKKTCDENNKRAKKKTSHSLESTLWQTKICIPVTCLRNWLISALNQKEIINEKRVKILSESRTECRERLGLQAIFDEKCECPDKEWIGKGRKS